MRLRKALALPLIAIFLLIILAWLQFRWLGQVSHAQEQQLQRFLENATQSVAQDVDREISRAFNFFVVGILESRDRKTELVVRQKAWEEQAPFPQLIEKIYYVETHDNQWQLYQLDDQYAWGEAPWSEDLESLKGAIHHPNEGDGRRPYGLVIGDVPALIAPPPLIFPRHGRFRRSGFTKFKRERRPPPEERRRSSEGRRDPSDEHRHSSNDRRHARHQDGRGHFSRNFGAVLVIFNRDYLAKEMLPQFMEAAFDAGPGLMPDYRLVHRQGKQEEITARGRVTEDAFYTDLMRLQGLTGLSPILPTPDELSEEELAWRETRTFHRYSEMARHLYEMALGGFGEGVWRLYVSHSADALQQVVSQTRTKNLAVSISILGLLGASMILVFISSARNRELADRQLEFVAGISHELLTPLAGVRGAGQNLAAGVVKDLDRVAQYGQVIEKESDRLTQMIRQVLAYAGMRSGHPIQDTQPLQLQQVLLDAWEDCATVLDPFEKDVNLPEDLGTVMGDPMALRRVVQNLVGNVVKYAATTPWIGFYAGKESNRVWFEIRDRGPGIDPQDLKHLFEPFYRGKKHVAGTTPGSGLGLCIVQHIVHAHQGKVSVHAPPGQGSCFRVVLPLKEH